MMRTYLLSKSVTTLILSLMLAGAAVEATVYAQPAPEHVSIDIVSQHGGTLTDLVATDSGVAVLARHGLIEIARDSFSIDMSGARMSGYVADCMVELAVSGGLRAVLARSSCDEDYERFGILLFELDETGTPRFLSSTYWNRVDDIDQSAPFVPGLDGWVVASTDEFVFASSPDSRLHVVDVRDRLRPERRSVFDLSDDRGLPVRVVELVHVGVFLFVLTNAHPAYLQILDISDPSELKLLHRVRVGSIALALDIDEGVAVVSTARSDTSSFCREASLFVIDVSSPESAHIIGEHNLDKQCQSVQELGLEGSILWTRSNNGPFARHAERDIRFYDISDPAAFVSDGTIRVADVTHATVVDDRLVVIGSLGDVRLPSAVAIYEISRPWIEMPSYVETNWLGHLPFVYTADEVSSSATAGKVLVHGDGYSWKAYGRANTTYPWRAGHPMNERLQDVTSINLEDLISGYGQYFLIAGLPIGADDPEVALGELGLNPPSMLSAPISLPAPAVPSRFDIARSGRLVAVLGVGVHRMWYVDIENHALGAVISQDLPGPAVAIEMDEKFTYVAFAGGNDGIARDLWILDRTVPSVARPVARFDSGVPIVDLQMYEDWLVVSAGSHGLRILDVSDPARPSIVDRMEGINAGDMVVSKGLLFTATTGEAAIPGHPSQPGLMAAAIDDAGTVREIGYIDLPRHSRLAPHPRGLVAAAGDAGLFILEVSDSQGLPTRTPQPTPSPLPTREYRDERIFLPIVLNQPETWTQR